MSIQVFRLTFNASDTRLPALFLLKEPENDARKLHISYEINETKYDLDFEVDSDWEKNWVTINIEQVYDQKYVYTVTIDDKLMIQTVNQYPKNRDGLIVTLGTGHGQKRSNSMPSSFKKLFGRSF